MSLDVRTVTATRYVTPLREGGSLPAIVEADDDGLYVLKFRGAGQGPKALIAELVAGEAGRALGLPVPEIVFVELDAALAGTEPDPEIQDLIKASVGLNLALDYLPGSVMYDPLVEKLEPALASAVVWFDAYVTNVDRTPRNANMLMWHKKLWLIDHGASLYFHHTWTDYMERSRSPFEHIKDHVLLPYATMLEDVDATLSKRMTEEVITNIVGLIPDVWLDTDSLLKSAYEARQAYVEYLSRRLEAPRPFAEEAERARRASHI
ncbi:MAG: aminotransferase class I and II [Pyrinomonadaceae bacterium]|nr:aminotransferase class I and II [Pyrinomonadaceae bacterium]